ncbi:MAG: NADH-quinone oxidoreductase subunit A [Phycisphaerae bacterium]|nr:NADH-quinone oxidoreductase subunit A [Phycisphaerae bacterium]
MLVVAGLIVGAMVFFSWLFGPGRSGAEKGSVYECGVDPVGPARNRFHSRFYLLAILFLLFDVELIFFYPWAILFNHDTSGVYLIEIGIFTTILLVAFVYAWGKGVFDWR